MDTDHERAAIISELQKINERLADKPSLWRNFLIGIVYGVGFVLGSAFVATMLIGVLGPYLADIPWVQHAFTSGVQLLRQSR